MEPLLCYISVLSSKFEILKKESIINKCKDNYYHELNDKESEENLIFEKKKKK